MHDEAIYENWRREFSFDVPRKFNYTADIVDTWAEREPNRLALVAVAADGVTTSHYSFADISANAARAANAFRALGIRKGDRVLVQLPRIPSWYSVLLGCFKIGAVPMPGTVQLTSRDIAYRLHASDATVVIVDLEGAAKVDAIADECPMVKHKVVASGQREGWTSFDDALASAADFAETEVTDSDDPLVLYFTSGTTAHPKMVLHTHASLGIGHEITARFWQDLTPEDLHWTISDFGWAKAGWGKLFGQWRLGAAIFLWNVVGPPDYERMLGLIGEHRVTTFCAPPTVYRVFVQMSLEKYDWSNLRHCCAAGEPLNPEVISVWKEATGLEIYDGYGQTETVCLVANSKSFPVRRGSMGRPMPGFDVQIVDDEGSILGRGDEGNIAVRTDPRPVGLFTEYWRDPKKNNEVFQGDWYYTGDRAYRDEDGYFWFVGRADDVILSAGYRIGPFEVESALIEHPAVMEAAVVGKPDPTRGEIVKAFVVLVPGYEGSDDLGAEMQQYVKTVTAPYKYPREIEFVTELPKTISGKIRRIELRQRERAR